MKLIRYLFVGLLISGVYWGIHHPDQIKGAINTSTLMKQLTPMQSVVGTNHHQHTSTRSMANHALYYTPDTDPESVDVPLIDEVKSGSHIDAAFYSFTDRPTAEALLAAANRGVTIRIYLKVRGKFRRSGRRCRARLLL